MREEPILREMTEKDWPEFHSFDIHSFGDDTMKRDSFLKRVTREGFFALEIKKEIVGQLIVAPFGDDQGHLGRVAVAPKHQSKGYGSILVREALKWFRKKGIKSIHLYTQQDNYIAQGLYKKFGFEISGQAWQFFVPLQSLKGKGLYTCHPIKKDEIKYVEEKYNSFPEGQIQQFLQFQHLVFTLKNDALEIVGACRFTPSFPGCFPFEIDLLDSFDDFIIGLKPYMLPQFDYIRITQNDNEKLTKECEKRGYDLHHKLFKMTLFL
ncbi:MAG: GNAT family N-acetyltransferase [Candidatus Lokiarchaeota archaeon]|nr:GNAT family N-acetyltransferase [Candidatus Lokiarchaeota archaeon]